MIILQKREKKGKTAVLTDPPEKRSLEAEKLLTEKKKQNKGKAVKLLMLSDNSVKSIKRTKTYKVERTRTKNNSDDEEEDDKTTINLVCLDSFKNRVANEKWIQCISCTLWAHLKYCYRTINPSMGTVVTVCN